MDETSSLVVIVVCSAIVVAGPCVDRRRAARLLDGAHGRAATAHDGQRLVAVAPRCFR